MIEELKALVRYWQDDIEVLRVMKARNAHGKSDDYYDGRIRTWQVAILDLEAKIARHDANEQRVEEAFNARIAAQEGAQDECNN